MCALPCVFSGTGVAFFAHGVKYFGGWELGQKHGHGVELWASGRQYYGEWDHGVRKGFGCEMTGEGDWYCGQWSNDRPHGVGQMLWANGLVQRGYWCAGLYRGRGKTAVYDGKQPCTATATPCIRESMQEAKDVITQSNTRNGMLPRASGPLLPQRIEGNEGKNLNQKKKRNRCCRNEGKRKEHKSAGKSMKEGANAQCRLRQRNGRQVQKYRRKAAMAAVLLLVELPPLVRPRRSLPQSPLAPKAQSHCLHPLIA